MKIRPVEAELFHGDGQTELFHADGQTDELRDEQTDMRKLIVGFRNFATAPKN
jgi:hypothetical protein